MERIKMHPLQKSLSTKPVTEIWAITPAVAQMLLEKNKTNRRLRKFTVGKYARLMREGQWMLNNDSIVVSTEDALLNGQHRLHAVIESGCTVEMQVLWNANPLSFETMDRPVIRSAADALGQLGYVSTHALAAGVKAYWQITNQIWDRNSTIEPRQTIELLESLPNFQAAMDGHYKARHVITPGVAIACYYIFFNLDSAAAEEFMAKVGSGENLVATSPIYRLRERLNRQRGISMARQIEAALVIKCWNYWRQGKSMQALMWRDDEAFPTAV